MAKDKQYFCLVKIGFIAKKKNESDLFFSIYLIFYLIPKIYFKQYGWGVVIQINFFSSFSYCLLLLLLLLFNLMIVITVILLSLLFIIAVIFMFTLFLVLYLLYYV